MVKTKQKAKKIAKKDEKELKETLQRLQAEFENYKKRVENENANFKARAEADFIVSILPVLDNFELALKNHASPQEFLKGVELIYTQLFQTLEEKGLKHIECCNEKFDPYKHEALLTEESNKKENTVLQELQKGYTFNDKVIRHAKVKVSKKKSGGKQK